jgi:hypothetical protein
MSLLGLIARQRREFGSVTELVGLPGDPRTVTRVVPGSTSYLACPGCHTPLLITHHEDRSMVSHIIGGRNDPLIADGTGFPTDDDTLLTLQAACAGDSYLFNYLDEHPGGPWHHNQVILALIDEIRTLRRLRVLQADADSFTRAKQQLHDAAVEYAQAVQEQKDPRS